MYIFDNEAAECLQEMPRMQTDSHKESHLWSALRHRRLLCSKVYATSHSVVDDEPEWDEDRTRDFVVVGTIYYGPALHLWYCKILPAIAAVLFKGRSKLGRVSGSVLLDQAIFTPIFYCGYYLVDAAV